MPWDEIVNNFNKENTCNLFCFGFFISIKGYSSHDVEIMRND